MSDWRVWVALGVLVLYNAGWTLFCLEFGYRMGLRAAGRGPA